MASSAAMKTIETILKYGDCLDVLYEYPNDFFDLIATSSPYSDCREKTYGGIDPDH
jgi:site-specific DNA-methyltransferase (cytosine-N4-specific)